MFLLEPGGVSGDCRSAGAAPLQQQIAQVRADVQVAQQDIKDAQAAQAQVQANLNYLTVRSPIAALSTGQWLNGAEIS